MTPHAKPLSKSAQEILRTLERMARSGGIVVAMAAEIMVASGVRSRSTWSKSIRELIDANKVTTTQAQTRRGVLGRPPTTFHVHTAGAAPVTEIPFHGRLAMIHDMLVVYKLGKIPKSAHGQTSHEIAIKFASDLLEHDIRRYGFSLVNEVAKGFHAGLRIGEFYPYWKQALANRKTVEERFASDSDVAIEGTEFKRASVDLMMKVEALRPVMKAPTASVAGKAALVGSAAPTQSENDALRRERAAAEFFATAARRSIPFGS